MHLPLCDSITKLQTLCLSANWIHSTETSFVLVSFHGCLESPSPRGHQALIKCLFGFLVSGQIKKKKKKKLKILTSFYLRECKTHKDTSLCGNIYEILQKTLDLLSNTPQTHCNHFNPVRSLLNVKRKHRWMFKKLKPLEEDVDVRHEQTVLADMENTNTKKYWTTESVTKPLQTRRQHVTRHPVLILLTVSNGSIISLHVAAGHQNVPQWQRGRFFLFADMFVSLTSLWLFDSLTSCHFPFFCTD